MHITCKIFMTLTLLLPSFFTTAAPFSVNYTALQSGFTNPVVDPAPGNPPFTISVTVVLDNGSSTSANQIWTAADIVSITFVLNSGLTNPSILEPNTAPGDGLEIASGAFTTDINGILTSTPTQWVDSINTNLVEGPWPGPSPYPRWRLDNMPPLVQALSYTTFASAEATAFANIGSTWSNPVAFAPPSSAQPAPTLSQWMLILLALMLGGIGFQVSRKLHN